MIQTTVGKQWKIKMMIFILFGVGIGLWGLLDATIVYPARGERHAKWAKLAYLQASEASGRLQFATIDDPRSDYERLKSAAREIETELQEAQARSLTRVEYEKQRELALLGWLTALARIGHLQPEFTTIDDPRADLEALTEELKSKNPPKPLAAYDIPTQWLIVVAGLGLGGYLIFLFMKVSRISFGYEPETKTLALPDGRKLTPADIREVDKRKWDKFIVFLQLKERDEEIRIDLYRHHPLEEWILDMEKDTEGYEPPEEDEADDESEEPVGAGAGSDAKD